jgi:hypothetical protein
VHDAEYFMDRLLREDARTLTREDQLLELFDQLPGFRQVGFEYRVALLNTHPIPPSHDSTLFDIFVCYS